MKDNPYFAPIKRFHSTLGAIEWRFPFIPSLVNAGVLLLIILVLCSLYATVGIASQISSSLLALIKEAQKEFRHGPSVEKSGYAVAIGIYLCLFIPIWLVQSPFRLLG
jgi:hypothetical protein